MPRTITNEEIYQANLTAIANGSLAAIHGKGERLRCNGFRCAIGCAMTADEIAMAEDEAGSEDPSDFAIELGYDPEPDEGNPKCIIIQVESMEAVSRLMLAHDKWAQAVRFATGDPEIERSEFEQIALDIAERHAQAAYKAALDEMHKVVP